MILFDLYWIFGMSVLTFLLYGFDKHQACYQGWRVPEALLLGMALMGGALGALLGMWLFRHKTKHRSFLICVPVFFALQTLVEVLLRLFVF